MKVTTEYIEQLINKYGDTALRVAFTYLKNRADAEDAVQDAFLRIINKKPEIAKITGSGEATARSLLHRARGKLKEILKEEYDFATV